MSILLRWQVYIASPIFSQRCVATTSLLLCTKEHALGITLSLERIIQPLVSVGTFMLQLGCMQQKTSVDPYSLRQHQIHTRSVLKFARGLANLASEAQRRLQNNRDLCRSICCIAEHNYTPVVRCSLIAYVAIAGACKG
jgi:hypothetical protein